MTVILRQALATAVPLQKYDGHLATACSLKSSNFRTVTRFAPLFAFCRTARSSNPDLSANC